MPVSPNNLQFSLSSEYLERLREKANPGESLGLTAKRILIAALDADKAETHPALIDRVTTLEAQVKDAFSKVSEAFSKLDRETGGNSRQLREMEEKHIALEERLTAIEVAIDCEHYPPEKVSERLANLEKLAKSGGTVTAITIDRIKDLEERVTGLENTDISPINEALDALKRNGETIESALAELRSQIGETTSPVKRPASPPPPPRRRGK